MNTLDRLVFLAKDPNRQIILQILFAELSREKPAQIIIDSCRAYLRESNRKAGC